MDTCAESTPAEAYEQGKKQAFKRQIGRWENMSYNEAEDCYICAEGRKLNLRRECSEYVQGGPVTTAYYRCESCAGCSRRSACCQAKDVDKPNELRLKRELIEKRASSQKNITTKQGIYYRLCRSIQVEGAFGLLKDNFGFRCFMTRGKTKVQMELYLLCLAFDLKKLWKKRENGRLRTHLSKLNTA